MGFRQVGGSLGDSVGVGQAAWHKNAKGTWNKEQSSSAKRSNLDSALTIAGMNLQELDNPSLNSSGKFIHSHYR
jgi:hypothetical protein